MIHRKSFLLSAGAAALLLTACGNNTEDNNSNPEAEENLNAEEENIQEEENLNEENESPENNAETEENSENAVTEADLELPQISEETEGLPQAVIETNMGDIEVVFYPEQAPLAVENFLTLAEEDYYDGIIFHRVIEDFMIQGGDPTGTGMGGESAFGESFEDEFDPSLAHFNGALSMANSGPNTNGSQFFIVQAGNEALDEAMFEESGFPEETVAHYLEEGGTPSLDFQHTVFGHVISGMDVVDEIANVETEGSDMPSDEVIIETITITEEME